MKANPLVISPSPEARLTLLPQLDPDLAHEINAGRSVLVFARNSASNGRGARTACVLDACQVVDDLASFGLDVRHLMPTEEQMDVWLTEAQPMQSRDATTGLPFRNRFVEVWLTPQFMLGLSVGTGSKMAEETLSQPFLDYLSQRVASTVPVLLHGKRWDRLGRRKWGLGPALEAMKTRSPAFLGEEDRIERLDETSELRAFIAGDQAERFAAKIPRQTRRGMRSRTGDEMRDGWVAYSISASPPPGLCRIRMQGSGVTARGEVRMYFEAPQWLPPHQHVALGYPQIVDPSTGELVDQVANVRWALTKLADPRWSYERIGQGLANRRFSHTHIRQLHGADAIAFPRPKKETKLRHDRPFTTVLAPIINNLDFYETGVLRRSLGVNGIEDVEITGVIPPDGPWATAETFAAIRHRRSGTKGRYGKSTMLLSRIPVTVNGKDGSLQQLPLSRVEPAYGFWDLERDCGIPIGATIRHKDLAQLIAEALDHAVSTGATLPRLGHQPEDSPLLEQARLRVATLERVKAETEAKIERIYQRMDDPHVDGPLLARMTTEYNTLIRESAPQTDRELELARSDESRIYDEVTALAGTTTDRLDEIVRALASPWASDVRYEIRSLIHSLRVRTERVRPHKDFRGVLAHIDLELALRDDTGDVALVRYSKTLPLSGALRFREYVEERRRLLSEGVPYSAFKKVATGGVSIQKGDLAKALGMKRHQSVMLQCADPRLLRINFAVFEAAKEGRTGEDGIVAELADRLGEPIALVSRCWDLYGPTQQRPRRWKRLRRPADPTERYCAKCQSLMLWTLIEEVAGGVCPACRHDEAGVEWPKEYDRWLTDQPTYTGK